MLTKGPREQLLPDCGSFRFPIGSDQIGLIGLAIAQKKPKTKNEQETEKKVEAHLRAAHTNCHISMGPSKCAPF